MDQFAVGFDLGKDYSQICCWNGSAESPVSVSVVSGAEKYRIPTENLELFLKKALRLLKPYGKIHDASAVVFSVETLEEGLVESIKRTAMQMIGVPESRIYVQTRQESFCSYVLNQPKEIWRHQAVLFDYEGELLKGMILNVNPRTIPFLARVECDKQWTIPLSGLLQPEKNEVFQELIRQMFSSRPISAVFLVGEGFEEKWYEDSLKLLCNGRRVFAGNNLYAKGSCYRAIQAAKRGAAASYVFFGADKISYNVCLRTPGTGKGGMYTLLNAGESWYEARACCEALLYDEPVVEFLFQPMQGTEGFKESMLLEGLPDRPSRATRLYIEAEFLKVDRLRLTVRDMGFGELFPSSDLCWVEEVELI